MSDEFSEEKNSRCYSIDMQPDSRLGMKAGMQLMESFYFYFILFYFIFYLIHLPLDAT